MTDVDKSAAEIRHHLMVTSRKTLEMKANSLRRNDEVTERLLFAIVQDEMSLLKLRDSIETKQQTLESLFENKETILYTSNEAVNEAIFGMEAKKPSQILTSKFIEAMNDFKDQINGCELHLDQYWKEREEELINNHDFGVSSING